MAMLECPGCKRIVDDTIKSCPGCSYDIKKYVKAMKKEAKKSGKSSGFGTIGLGAVYNAEPVAAINVPKLDFLSNQNSEELETPIFDSPSLNTPKTQPAEAPVFESPSLNMPKTQPTEAPVFESASLNMP